MPNHWSKKQIACSGEREGKEESLLAYQARLFWLAHPKTTNIDLAGEFNVDTSTISTWKKEYQWEAIYGEYVKDFLEESIQERSRLYMNFLRDNYFQSQKMLDGKISLYECACQNLGLMEGEPEFELSKKEALDIIKQTSIPDLHKMILRNLEVPYSINDTQKMTIQTIEEKDVDDYAVVKTIESLQRGLR